MGGEIGALSRPGAGSTFWFVLPLQSRHIACKSRPNPRHRFRRRCRSRLPRRPHCCRAGRKLPRRPHPRSCFWSRIISSISGLRFTCWPSLGYRVDVATTGVEAIVRLSRTRYQLVLMDCQMPEMDGFEATRRIRDRTSTVLDHEVPIVAMTANAFPEDRVRAIASGMNDFLSKPVDQSTLSAVIEKWLGAQGPPGGIAGSTGRRHSGARRRNGFMKRHENMLLTHHRRDAVAVHVGAQVRR